MPVFTDRLCRRVVGRSVRPCCVRTLQRPRQKAATSSTKFKRSSPNSNPKHKLKSISGQLRLTVASGHEGAPPKL